jgi:hypothetical protein
MLLVTRSTSKKKLEPTGEGTDAQRSETLRPITDEAEEDGWVVFLSDPASDTDDEGKHRTAEAARLKSPALAEGKSLGL